MTPARLPLSNNASTDATMRGQMRILSAVRRCPARARLRAASLRWAIYTTPWSTRSTGLPVDNISRIKYKNLYSNEEGPR